jgi:hypothetical protein
LAVSSLGAGGDMLFADEVLKRGIPLTVFLPFEKEKFIATSVDYLKGTPNENPEEWRKEFERILLLASEVIYLKSEGDNAYAHCNAEMLAYAIKKGDAAGRHVSAMALMRPDEKIIEGGSGIKHVHVREFIRQLI